MKMMQRLLIALCLIGLTSSIALAAAETVDLGPVKISADLQGIGSYKIEKENPSSLSYNYRGNTFTLQFFPATITASNTSTSDTSNRVLLEVYQMSAPQSLGIPIPQLSNKTGLESYIEKSDMMPSGKDVQKQTYYVDGHKGIAYIINRDKKGPIYLAAYSPDLKDDFGKTIVILGSDFPLNTTKHIFESFKAQLVLDNMIGQIGLGQGITGQSNMVQSNTGTSMGMAGQNRISMMNNMMAMMNNMTAMMNNMMGMSQGNIGQNGVKM